MPTWPERSTWGRVAEELRYVVFGPKPTPRWHDGHGCVTETHDHARCTHRVCEDLACEQDDCHVVVVPLADTVAYEWQHHPIWHAEVMQRRRKLAAGAVTLSEFKRSRWGRGPLPRG